MTPNIFRPFRPLEDRLAPAALVGPEMVANSATAGNQALPEIAAYAQGSVVVFADDVAGGLFGRLINADAVPMGEQFRLAGPGAVGPRVASLAGGGFVATWEQAGAIYAQAFRADSSSAGGPVRVDAGGFGRTPDLSGTIDGGFVVAWQRTDNAARAEIRSRRFGHDGTPREAELLAVPAAEREINSDPAVAGLAGGGHVIARSYLVARAGITDPLEPASVMFDRFDASNMRVGGGVAFSDKSYGAFGTTPEVVALTGGGFVVAYGRTVTPSLPAAVLAQRFDASGASAGPAFEVATAGGAAAPARGVGLPNGGFVLTYPSTTYDRSGTSVLAQEFDASANKVGTEIVVNQSLAGDQRSPSVAVGTGGRLTLAFASETLDGSGFGVALQKAMHAVPAPVTATQPATQPTALPPTPGGVAQRIASGSARGVASHVTVVDSAGTVLAELSPFGPSGLGTTVASADFNGDGTEDIVSGLGAGGLPLLTVHDGKTFQLLSIFYAFDPNFRGGVNVAAGDLDGDGRAEIVVGAGLGSFPVVRVLDGMTGSEKGTFLAFDPAFRGGLSVAVADLRGGGRPDIVIGAGPGGVPLVATFDGRTLAQTGSAVVFDPAFRGGVFVAAGDVTGDGAADLVVGAGYGGSPVVRVLDRAFTEQKSFLAADPAFRGGIAVQVAGARDGNPNPIVTGAGAGSTLVVAHDGTRSPVVPFAAKQATRQGVFGTLPATPAQMAQLARNNFLGAALS